MLTAKEIEFARQDFAELRGIIKGKALPALIAEIKASEGRHPIGICNIMDGDYGPVDDPSQAKTMDVNYKSLNPTICTGTDGFCNIDMGNSTVGLFSWHGRDGDEQPIGELSYEEITNTVRITDEQLFRYCETVADIAYSCGHSRLRISNNSRARISEIVSWAKEFNALHKDTDWNEVDYIETVDAFTESKIAEYRRQNAEEDGLIIKEDECEAIDIYLTPDKYPIAYERKVRCIMSGGMTRQEAERFVLTAPLQMELYYDIGRGLFAVESEAADSIPIYNPYTGEEIPKDD